MRYIATGLIWGVYKEGKLQDSFRYLEDGTFTTADEKEFLLPDNAVISLVHPIDLPDETEKQGDTLLRYSGKKVYLSNIYEFETADITTRIENNTLHIIDRSLNVVAQLSFVYEESDCFLKELYFSSVEEGEDINTIQLPKEERLPLSSIPERFISTLLDILNRAFPLNE